MIQTTYQLHHAKHSRRSHQIYLATLTLFTLLLLLLPVVRFDVGIRATGIIRPEIERTAIYTPVAGILKQFPHGENSLIYKGDTLAVIDPGSLPRQIEKLEQRISTLHLYQEDLERLKGADRLEPELLGRMKTTRYRRSLIELLRRLDRFKQEKELRKREHQRQVKLLENQNTSRQMAEESLYNLEQVRKEMEWIRHEKLYQWTLDHEELDERLDQLQTKRAEKTERFERHTVISPLTGSLLSVAPLQPGTYIPQNERIGELSPTGNLEAELYIPTNDIGLLEEGMPVRLRIDALDHREWGVLEGTITDLPDDVTLQNGKTYYRVRSGLHQNWLELPSGYRNELIKGMSLQARLIVAERTLLQLLFDRIDDWLNPRWNNPEHQERT